MSIFKCKMCGGNLEVQEGQNIGVCDSCGSTMTVPRLDSERRINLYDRAEHFRRNNEYDKAMGIYEGILNEEPTDAEAYWSLVLCKYGVEYVEDPVSHKRIPTCNRTQRQSVLADEDYKAAIRHAVGYAKELYEKEATVIEEIQKNILSISLQEKPYDIFICYKESDEQGRRTKDSVCAQDMYNQLTKEGYRVFFSRISLEDKIGTAYEPYIYAALSSAKVMLAVGTRKEYFEAVWVKNEWSRFLGMMKENDKKMLIPVYRDMDPYDMPDELLHLQAQDMGKIGFMQDLLYGLGKVFGKKEQTEEVKTYPDKYESSVNVSNLIKRIEIFLEEHDFAKAKMYCEKVMDIKVDEPKVYIAFLRIEAYEERRLFLKTWDEVAYIPTNIKLHKHFRNALQYADEEYKKELDDIQRINESFCFRHCSGQIADNPDCNYSGVIPLIEEFAIENGAGRWSELLRCAQGMQKKQEILRGNELGVARQTYREAQDSYKTMFLQIKESKENGEYAKEDCAQFEQKLSINNVWNTVIVIICGLLFLLIMLSPIATIDKVWIGILFVFIAICIIAAVQVKQEDLKKQVVRLKCEIQQAEDLQNSLTKRIGTAKNVSESASEEYLQKQNQYNRAKEEMEQLRLEAQELKERKE